MMSIRKIIIVLALLAGYVAATALSIVCDVLDKIDVWMGRK